MSSILTLVLLFVSFVPLFVHGSPCIAMDADFNLLVFGINGNDYNAGQQSSWAGCENFRGLALDLFIYLLFSA